MLNLKEQKTNEPKLLDAVEDCLRRMLQHAEWIGKVLERCLSETYRPNAAQAKHYCKALRWRLNPVARSADRTDLDALKGFGVPSVSLRSALSPGVLGEDFPEAVEWLWQLLDCLPKGIWAGKARPTPELVKDWKQATAMLRGCLDSELPAFRQRRLMKQEEQAQEEEPVSLREFIERFCKCVKTGRAQQLAEAVMKEARRQKPRLTLPPTTNNAKGNQKKLFLPSVLRPKWPEFQRVIGTLPDLLE